MSSAQPLPPLSQDLVKLLLHLGRPGCRLAIGTDGAGQTTGAGKSRDVAAACVRAAGEAGLLSLTPDPEGGATAHLSPAGREALRRMLADGAARPAQVASTAAPGLSPRSQRRRRQARLADFDIGATPQRPLERRSVVEQLAARTDARGLPLLGEALVAAAARFTRDFAIGQMQPRVTARWAADAAPEPQRRAAPGAGVEISDRAAAAQARVRSALAILGGTLADLVMDVCAFDQGLEAAEAQRSWPRGSGRIVLAAALEQLGRHYGMIVPQRADRMAVRQWGDADFKPTADAWLST